MAYRNTIISLATLVAFGTACSKAPSYNTGVQSAGTAQDAAAVDPNDTSIDIPHGPNPEKPTVVTAEPKKEETATPATPPPANTPATAPLTPEQKAKSIAEKGFVAYAVSAPNGQGWNTEATPFLIGQTVNAGGAIDTAKPVTVYFCNYSAGQMRLHSGSGDGPMQHGAAFAGLATAVPAAELPAKQAELDKMGLAEVQAMPNCRAHAVTALGSQPGATYNHNGGAANNVASRVYFKVYTVDPAGAVALRAP
jgi:hypothetical protein